MKQHIAIGVKHLQRSDAVLSSVIETAGYCLLRRERDRFAMLVRSVIGQQLSAKAARTIRDRLNARVGTLNAVSLLELSDDDFKLAGVSPQKRAYIRDLAERVSTGSLPLNHFGRFGDDEVVRRLVEIKGIGKWTAQMFLIFALGRLDVLPHDDKGVQGAMRQLYGLESHPNPDEMEEIAAPWRPYASIACWYCWRYLDTPKPKT
ncbi:DNA-3-methyladenine glycosylase family protein [Blastopirellula marina]|uniref:DNA-3-methyladenine glycosylase II n=1 Tax=Blastopirellula marina TaxID=124 RepID=A0A2S8GSJ6_9BACT|nr:DNA-3-methyladenine glycosylase [Blastopirellula marina]PQO47403.1 DNA-3-methyladenine glycosylase 2 family protein [Blastopirellula marina]